MIFRGIVMTQTDPTFKPFWKRWRGPPGDARLANINEGIYEARVEWKKLSPEHRALAHEWGPHFQKEFKRANGDDCAMLHCCRYLSKKRFLNYEDDEPQDVLMTIKASDPGYDAWVEHIRMTHQNPMAYTLYIKGGRFHNQMRQTTPFPPDQGVE